MISLAVGAHEDGGQGARRWLSRCKPRRRPDVVRAGLHGLVGTVHRPMKAGSFWLSPASDLTDPVLRSFEHNVHTALLRSRPRFTSFSLHSLGKILQAQEIVDGLVLDRVQIGPFSACSRLVERSRRLGLFSRRCNVLNENMSWYTHAITKTIVGTLSHLCVFALSFKIFFVFFIFFCVSSQNFRAFRHAFRSLPFRRQIYKKVQKPKPLRRFSDFTATCNPSHLFGVRTQCHPLRPVAAIPQSTPPHAMK